MSKRFVFAAAAVLALAWAKPSAAATISFDVNGTGGGTGVVENVFRFDWAPGNSLLIEDVDAQGNLTGTATILYQANLQAVDSFNPGADYLNGSTYEGVQGAFITAVASFKGTLTPGGFTVLPGSGVFNIYADAEEGNDLTGKGFALDAGAQLILSGTAVSGSGTLTPTTLPPTITTLDQTPDGDDWSGYQTIEGSGGISNIQVQVLTYNTNYFLTAPGEFIFRSTSSGSNNLPFTQVDPSAFFSSNGVADGDEQGVGGAGMGPINGLGTRIIAESDASSTFATVPEPATLTLLGLGLAGSAAARRRQKKAQQQA